MNELLPQPARSIGTWVKLLAVWCAGLVMWAIYLALIVYGVFIVFG
ncbi:MAG: hypothetical protein ACREIT_05140 [Tepidisphaeraceae bacterium]